MTYQALKPAPNDLLTISVSDIQGNFLTANQVMTVDHYPFDDTTVNKGKHKPIHMPSGGALVPSTIADELALYVKGSGATTQLYMLEQDSVTSGAKERQISGPVTLNAGALTLGGSIPLFGGLVLKFGKVTTVAGANAYTFAAETGSAFSQIFSFYAQGTFPGVNTLGTIQFDTVNFSFSQVSVTTPSAVFWAIGLQ
jgi:hypothetical protein